MADLSAYARSRGLPRVAEFLSHVKLPAEAAADPGLCEPLATDAPSALRQMVRRGLESRLAAPVLAWLADRPVERGLLSWDLLSGSLLGPGEDELMQTLRSHARIVRAALPEAGAQYTRIAGTSIAELVTSLDGDRFAKSSEEQILAAVAQRDLGAVEELRRRKLIEPLAVKLLPAFRAFATALHQAHLPTLASFYLEYLYRALGDRASLAPWCEVLLDMGGVDALPADGELIGDRGPADADLAGYIGIRSSIDLDQTADYMHSAAAKVSYSDGNLDKLATQMPRTQVAHAEMMLKENGNLVPFELLTRIVAAVPAWRYGYRVLTTNAAARFPKSGECVTLVDTFVAGFGNDYKLWYETNRNAPAGTTWLDEIYARLVRELTYLPHDVSAWSALTTILQPEHPEALLGEVNQRAEWQCNL